MRGRPARKCPGRAAATDCGSAVEPSPANALAEEANTFSASPCCSSSLVAVLGFPAHVKASVLSIDETFPIDALAGLPLTVVLYDLLATRRVQRTTVVGIAATLVATFGALAIANSSVGAAFVTALE